VSDLDSTQLLLEARRGDREAMDRLYVHLYDDLRAVASRRLERFRPGQTLNTTALVHEAYLRLVDQTRVDFRDRAHFLALAARAMRFIVVDYARARSAEKRGGGEAPLPLDAVQLAAHERAGSLLALDEALRRLEAEDRRLGQVVELRFFGGLTHEELAEITGRSVPTVKRDWIRARAWLYRAMKDGG